MDELLGKDPLEELELMRASMVLTAEERELVLGWMDGELEKIARGEFSRPISSGIGLDYATACVFSGVSFFRHEVTREKVREYAERCDGQERALEQLARGKLVLMAFQREAKKEGLAYAALRHVGKSPVLHQHQVTHALMDPKAQAAVRAREAKKELDRAVGTAAIPEDKAEHTIRALEVMDRGVVLDVSAEEMAEGERGGLAGEIEEDDDGD